MTRPEDPHREPLPDGVSVRSLRAVAFAGSEASWAAFAALAHSGDEAALDVLVEGCAASDRYVRRAAVEGIGVHASGRRAAATVVQMLGDERGVVRRSACVAAATLGLTEARDALHELRCASSPATRAAAVRALASLWEHDDLELVLPQFERDPAARVRREIGWTLRTNAGPQHAARLFELWCRDGLPRHRAWACELAAEHPDPRYREGLDELAADPDGHVRRQAVRALAKLDRSG